MSDDALLTKQTVLGMLQETKQLLFVHLKAALKIAPGDNPRESLNTVVPIVLLEVVYGIDEIVGESRCCITSAQTLSHFYRWSSCMLERSLDFLNNGDNQAIQAHIKKLEEAHRAVKPFVLAEYSDGSAFKDKLRELGF